MRGGDFEEFHVPGEGVGELLLGERRGGGLQEGVVVVEDGYFQEPLEFAHGKAVIIIGKSRYKGILVLVVVILVDNNIFKEMSETPFSSIQKKQRQRKMLLVTNIEKKDLKYRSTSYNLKIQSDTHNPEPDKSKERHRASFNHSAKKSYYCRKFLNRSVDGKLTSQDFAKFKDKMSKVHFLDNGRHTIFQGKELRHKNDEKGVEASLEINTFGREQKQNHKTAQSGQPVLIFQRTTEERDKDKVERVESISQIAEKRKMSLDFDLQIQGNKKSIRVKDVTHPKPPKKKCSNLEEYQPSPGNWTPSALINQNQTQEVQLETLKPPCTFFKRFKEKHYPKSEDREEDYLLVNKIRYNLQKLQEVAHPGFPFERSNTGDYHRTYDTAYHIRKQIRSSYNSAASDKSRKDKIVTAEPHRLPKGRAQKQKINFVNDIRGWNVKNQNEGEDDEGMLFN